jgi:hypothetical protein
MQPDFLAIALDMEARGLSVTPLEGKAPFLPDWPSTASRDKKVITAWSVKYPNHNAGVVANEDYWMLDVDHMGWFMDHAPGMPETLTVLTGSGKLHIYFKGKKPAGLNTVKNPAHVSKEETPNEPVKLLEYPQQVVAPGSIHPGTGQPYTIQQDLPLAEISAEWLKWLRSLNEAKNLAKKSAALVVREDWNPEVELALAGLKFTVRKDGELVYLDYHAKEGRCLTRQGGGPHHTNGAVDGPMQSRFLVRKLANGWDLAHQCFSCGGGKTKEALKELGIELKDLVVKDGIAGELRSLGKRTKQHLRWLWPGYLPLNKLVHCGGASGEGKSPAWRDIIARVTSGNDWPDGTKNELGPRSVILLSSEDDPEDTVIPHLELAGADVNKVFELVITARKGDSESEISAALDRDMKKLAELAATIDDLALIVVDPVTNYLGHVKMNDEAEVRSSVLMPLHDIAKSCGICTVTIGHFNKNREGTTQQRFMGAAAFYGVARFVFVFGNDPEDEDKYAHVMHEHRNKNVALRYKTKIVPMTWDGATSNIVAVEWCGASTADVDEVVNAPKQSEKSAAAQVKMLMKTILRDGAKTSAFVEQAIKDSGIVISNWQDPARKVAKARQIKGQGKNAGWEWYLPAPEQFDI